MNFHDLMNRRALPSALWLRICFAPALWQWTKFALESQARLVTVHSIQSLTLSSSCATSSSALFSPVSTLKWHILEYDWKTILFHCLRKWSKIQDETTNLFIGIAVEHSHQKALWSDPVSRKVHYTLQLKKSCCIMQSIKKTEWNYCT